MTVTPEPTPALASLPQSLEGLTPAMRQYVEFKKQHPDYLLLFRMGDFYELFYDDARLAHRVLGVTLTSRSKGGLSAEDAVPMAGVPFHAIEGYLRRLIAAGHKVALCEQVEDPATAKGVVRREVTRLLTPGTLTDDPFLDGRSDNLLAAIATGISKASGYQCGAAWVDLSVGRLVVTSGDERSVLDELQRLSPAEVLLPETATGQPHPLTHELQKLGLKTVTVRPGWQFTPHHALETLQQHYKVRGVAGFGLGDDDPATVAAGAILSYLQETQKTSLDHLRAPTRHVTEDHLLIDPATWRSLEIDRTVRGNAAEGSLLHAIDRTVTSMGARLLRHWLRHPLREVEHILARQRAVAALVEAPTENERLRDALKDVCDVERVSARIAVGRAAPRDLAALCRSLAAVPAMCERLRSIDQWADIVPELGELSGFCGEQSAYLLSAIRAEPAAHLREGGVIVEGFDAELDRLRHISNDTQQAMAEYQAKLAGESGIDRLKVGYNKVFGYYIEVTETNRSKVPADWTRKQTVKNAERYITAELKDFESQVLGSRDRAIALEAELFERVRQALLPHLPTLQDLAATIARLDVLSSLAVLARERRYNRPTIDDSRFLRIVDGKHPVLEQMLGADFVANDVGFQAADTVQLITGPNMAGKSTYIRQVTLIVLLAQIGSYVPAAEAHIGVADRLFARIGASDELHGGQSTFMVEMTETANILNNATDHSVVVLDEIGRGTSTLDGLSLAWAIAEHLASTVRPRVLFATHYHELTRLADEHGGVRNLNVSVREWGDQVIFLHRIVEGGTDKSYGLHVARLAGVPKSVVEQARKLLRRLSVRHDGLGASTPQLELFAAKPPAPAEVPPMVKALAELDPDALSPREALKLLRR